MKWKFRLLRHALVGLMGLLPMLAACIRSAPIHEPDPLIDADNARTDPTRIKEQSKNVTKKVSPYATLCNQLPKHYSTSPYIATLLNEIGWRKDLVLYDGQAQSSSTTPNALPTRLFTFFKKDRKDSAWYERSSIEPEAITIRCHPALPNSTKHAYDLVGFVIDGPAENDAPAQHHSKVSLIPFVQEGQQWYFYNNDHSKRPLATLDAMRLASKEGTIFFYQESN